MTFRSTQKSRLLFVRLSRLWLLFGYFLLSVRVSLGFRQAHNLKVAGSNPAPATNKMIFSNTAILPDGGFCFLGGIVAMARLERQAKNMAF